MSQGTQKDPIPVQRSLLEVSVGSVSSNKAPELMIHVSWPQYSILKHEKRLLYYHQRGETHLPLSGMAYGTKLDIVA